MNTPEHPDDSELRELLDSLGITEESDTPALDEAEHARAAQALRRITEREPTHGTTPRQSSRRRWIPAGAAIVIAATLALVLVILEPFSGSRPAMAQTPPVLTFSGVPMGTLPSSGTPANEELSKLAGLAQRLPPALSDKPIQNIELDAWWPTSSFSEGGDKPRTALVPNRVSIYQTPDGERRTIERRGAPLDEDGRVSHEDPDWDDAPLIDDTTVDLDGDQGADYPSTLPLKVDELREQLAPTSACGEQTGGCLLSAVSDLYGGYVIDPELAALLWEAMASDPTITTLGETTDRLGRTAVVFTALSSDPHQQILVLADPDTGQFLGSEHVLIEEDPAVGFTPPAVVEFTALISSRRIDPSDVPDDSATKRY